LWSAYFRGLPHSRFQPPFLVRTPPARRHTSRTHRELAPSILKKSVLPSAPACSQRSEEAVAVAAVAAVAAVEVWVKGTRRASAQAPCAARRLARDCQEGFSSTRRRGSPSVASTSGRSFSSFPSLPDLSLPPASWVSGDRGGPPPERGGNASPLPLPSCLFGSRSGEQSGVSNCESSSSFSASACVHVCSCHHHPQREVNADTRREKER
jgi:hypothetical protein